ncbi:hypothetical protein KXD40_003058 [Peronospora effusa]|uniref:Uncharacterized protein n=1 Tax=Peronospora effusa TaxID=542832 RepID=A0A3M6VUP4_9STRA|nr:hypothetical protein DD238_007946 [Peronospora effusa]RQM11023.1 hypothetical protein DD237_008461 [Peronospora effusa]UIZ29277.1 hypothetical protein KXD40_003058 [Peronospora effusa]CAI5702688.1 unnamed protein product [Peronospora effusa]
MAALPIGMQLVSALDDSELSLLGDASSTASEHVQSTLLLPLESDDAALDMEMDVDLNIFRPSAMLDADIFGSDSSELYFGSIFQPNWGDGQDNIEQMLLCGSEEAALHNHHQHETTPGQDCQCRNFAIRANRVQAQQERVVDAIAAKDQKRVLRHTFGSGKKLLGFGFGEGAVMDKSQQQDIAMMDGLSTSILHVDGAGLEIKQEVLDTKDDVAMVATKLMPPTSFAVMKQEAPSTPKRALHKARSLADDELFSSPLHHSQPLFAVSSPLSTTSFVSLEGTMATPLSTTSRSTVHSGMPMMRSLSPADELEKMASSGSQTSMHKMNILRGNFQVSAGRDTVPLVKPSAVLPPPYFRGALDSPEKRRVHSKTFSSFAQSLSFSFANESLTHK